MRRRLLNRMPNNLPIKPIEDSVAADICIVDNETLDKLIVDGEEYNLETFPLEQYTPIGMVVVPASHTDNGTARIISLVSMDYNNPDNGNVYEHIGICWGGYGYDVNHLNNLTGTPFISDDYYSGIGSTQIIKGFETKGGFVPIFSSDYFEMLENPFDEGTYFGGDCKYLGASPYITGDFKNEIYNNIDNINNIYIDMDGKGNTEKILENDNSYSTDWQTASTIQNVEDNQYIHPAAQCCWRYHTIGTQQGDWYLPSAGELLYLGARFKKINNFIIKISNSYFLSLSLPFNNEIWSSTPYSRNSGIHYCINAQSTLSFNYGGGGFKTNNNYVRAFCKI